MVIYDIAENLIRASERFKDKVAVRAKTASGWSSFTYGELGQKVKAMAFYLSGLGISKGDRVAIILENRQEWPVVFFALSHIGAVAVPLDPHFNQKDIDNILSDSGARSVFVSKKDDRSIGILKDILPLIYIEEIETLPLQPRDFKKTPVAPDDIMVLLYTSGTTDLPKGVMLTHKNLCSNFISLSKTKIFSPRDVILSVLPLYHSYALMTTFITPIFSGSMIVFVPPDWPERLVDYIRETKTTIFLGVPQIYHMMHSRMMKKLNEVQGLAGLYVRLAINLGLARILLPKIRNAFGPGLRFFISGGAKLDTGVARDFSRLGFRILEGYGLTETSPVASMNPMKRPKIGSIGRPVPDVSLKIVNKDLNGIGEIAIQGPNVMKGYYRNEDKTKEVIRDNWFLSGDLGYEDKDGYFYITGRSKEVIVLSSGKNIYPEEIEKHYSAIPYIKEMCVLGVVKERGGGRLEYLHAVVVPDLDFFKARGEMNIKKVIGNNFENLSKGIAPYKHIMGFTVTSEPLPRTVLGKIKRYEVQKKFLPLILEEGAKKEITADERELTESGTAQRLISCIKDALDIDGPVSLGDSIELDLGVDSLSRVELVLAVEKCFDVEFPEEMVAGEIFTVKDILLRVEQLLEDGKQAGVSSSAAAPGTGMRQEKERPLLWHDIVRQELAGEFKKKILLRPGWTGYLLTFTVKGAINIFFRVFYGLRVEGARHIPKKGPYVLCVNHTSFLDGFIVAAAVPFNTKLDLFFIAFRRYFTAPVIRNLVRRARIIPIDATQIIEAMQGSAFILKHNKALCIFPEGERSIDGQVKEFKKGIGIISKELDVPLVPVFIKGAFEAWPRTERFPRLHRLKVKFGKPVPAGELINNGMRLGARDEYDAICLGIRDEVLKLV